MAKYETWMRALLSDSGIEGCTQRTYQPGAALSFFHFTFFNAAHLETKLRLLQQIFYFQVAEIEQIRYRCDGT